MVFEKAEKHDWIENLLHLLWMLEEIIGRVTGWCSLKD